MIKRIFLDLDDVLNVLTPYLLYRAGCDIGPTDYESYPGDKCGYDITEAANMLHAVRMYPFTNESFWRSVSRMTWATCPKSKEFELLLMLSCDAVGEGIYVLTKAVDTDSCLAGKKDWMDSNLPGWLRRKYIMVGENCKHLLANSESLLIDDFDDNVNAFRKSGGLAITMPRPWNICRDIKETKSYLTDKFVKIFGSNYGA